MMNNSSDVECVPRTASRFIAVGLFLLATTGFGFGQNPRVQINAGMIAGRQDRGVETFKGIPYALPPVGALRWRAPQPVATWGATLEADHYAADCMQWPFPGDAAPLGTPPSEDCLYVNVWRPAATTDSAKLPVMVWIYGGGFVNGGSSPAVYSGEQFASKGVVFVSFNYRLGRFGFFAFPALTAEHADPALGNYGFMDQIAALNWVQQNISAFGGDRRNVTVFGESAGGMSVHMLLTSPQGKGLFSKAIIESGGGRNWIGGMRFLSTALPEGKPSAEAAGIAFAESVGIQATDSRALERLRALPAETVRGHLNMASIGDPTYAGPMIDGKIVLANPEAVYLEGDETAVPLIVGANSADIGFVPGTSKQGLFAQFGPDASRAAAAYDPSGTTELSKVRMEVGMDRGMLEPARFVARAFAAAGVPVYEYRFAYVAQSMRDKWTGAPHATEIPFVFDTVDARYGQTLKPADAKTADLMLNAWVSFAKTADPNTNGRMGWPRYSVKEDELLEIGNAGATTKQDSRRVQLDLAERVASTPSAGSKHQ